MDPFGPPAGSSPATPGGYPPPGYDPQASGPPPGYGPPTYGPPAYGPPAYGPPAYGSPPGYGAPAGGLPPTYYAGPQDPLVSADFSGWWDRSSRLIRAAWQPLALIQLIAAVPLFVVSVATTLVTNSDVVVSESTDFDAATFFGALFGIFALFLIPVVLGLITQLAALRYLVQLALGQPITIGQALRSVLGRAPALLGWAIVAGLIILVGLILCVLPGLYMIAVVAVLPAIVLLEPGKGLGRAFELFHADFGAALARIATLMGITIGISFATSFILGALTPATDPAVATVVLTELVTAAFSVAIGIVFSPMLLTAYADMRARKEPFSTAYLASER
ncbi:hypothetical protein Ari01nite_32200 [Paractinoplanes rishiriensis]|uniref:Glycerophosphoryl diester phosphodiesterase membrane domain-containing protein n=1 Tax=Paractinoplanes rishiriensis TaxID=1050105 RepID=A0A919JYC6_9ACTN|nr:hypothetical protein Ari01nite_32200 [Actinoplanes rishiriensis]